MSLFKHFKLIVKHRFFTMLYCFKCGLIWQGLVHDLSKFSPAEFISGATYYNGKVSPIQLEKRDKGYSKGWLHHKGRNKHHIEYWVDFKSDGQIVLVAIPKKYVVEMICDWVSASRVYNGSLDKDKFLQYVKPISKSSIINDKTKEVIKKALCVLENTDSFDSMFSYCKTIIREK